MWADLNPVGSSKTRGNARNGNKCYCVGRNMGFVMDQEKGFAKSVACGMCVCWVGVFCKMCLDNSCL